ncbi:MAG: hypothetical protein AW09_002877 [Candidatus Accumulibacter phosphatis]|uniref:Uncharacterized protein n=1 Tax=Candidatus Accumulibacter phosphatis TaxID=327160 RepID=A0A080LTT8_9PROT|nr:MAG: hypothetical protein AW09_002877 [Candidatus Accumulibacter phosphatis]
MYRLDSGLGEFRQQALGDFVIGVGQDLATALVNDVLGNHPANQKIIRNSNLLDPGLIEFTDVLGGNPLVLADDQLPGRVVKVETRDFPAQTLWNERKLDYPLAQIEGVKLEKLTQNALRCQADRLQQRSDRHLAATVDTEKQQILGIELEIQP